MKRMRGIRIPYKDVGHWWFAEVTVDKGEVDAAYVDFIFWDIPRTLLLPMHEEDVVNYFKEQILEIVEKRGEEEESND